jgi:hypothetical protein
LTLKFRSKIEIKHKTKHKKTNELHLGPRG